MPNFNILQSIHNIETVLNNYLQTIELFEKKRKKEISLEIDNSQSACTMKGRPLHL